MSKPKLIKQPKRLRRICWCSLAVVVLTFIGLWSIAFWRYEKQQAAIAEIERLGGSVYFEPSGPDWLRGVFHSSSVSFGTESQITDVSLRHLKDLINVERLVLFNMQITDEGLNHLSGLKNLEFAWLDTHSTEEDRLSKQHCQIVTSFMVSRRPVGDRFCGWTPIEDRRAHGTERAGLLGRFSLDALERQDLSMP